MFQAHKKTSLMIPNQEFKKNSILSNFDASKSILSRSSLLSHDSKKSSMKKFINPKNSIFSLMYGEISNDIDSRLGDFDKTFKLDNNSIMNQSKLKLSKKENILQRLLTNNNLGIYKSSSENKKKLKTDLDLSEYCKKVQRNNSLSINLRENKKSPNKNMSKKTVVSGVYSKEKVPFSILQHRKSKSLDKLNKSKVKR